MTFEEEQKVKTFMEKNLNNMNLNYDDIKTELFFLDSNELNSVLSTMKNKTNDINIISNKLKEKNRDIEIISGKLKGE